MDMNLTVFGVLGFLAVVLALQGAYTLWASRHGAEARRIAARLAAQGGSAHAELSLERARESPRLPWLKALLQGSAWGQALARWVGTSGVQVSAAELLALSAALWVVGMLLPVLVFHSVLAGLVAGPLLAALPWWRVGSRRARRLQRLERQFPEALDFLGRAMRAGHSFPSAIRMAGEELAEPMGHDFRMLSDEMKYGAPVQDALAALAARVPLGDMRYFVVAVMIQRESGGNLAELLDNIGTIVRERLKLRGEVRTLSAEGRLSAWILVALPFCMALLVNLVNPAFMSVLWTDPIGIRLIGGSLGLMLVGGLWMRKTIRIRV